MNPQGMMNQIGSIKIRVLDDDAIYDAKQNLEKIKSEYEYIKSIEDISEETKSAILIEISLKFDIAKSEFHDLIDSLKISKEG